MDERGALLFEYWPLPFSPMTVASLLLVVIVTAAAPVALPPDLFPLDGLCFLPLLVLVLYAVLKLPTATRIYGDGIEPSRPLWRQGFGARFLPWSRVRNVYPAAYEIAGAAMSPFASSAGTLVHIGLGIETTDGRRRVVKFTPGSIRAFRGETEGYRYAMASVREAFAALGRPLVTEVRPYTETEVLAMHEEARRPLVGMGAIVFAFFLPPVIATATFVGLASVLGPTPPLAVVAVVVALAAVPPVVSTAWTYGKSRRRNWVLGELAKHEEALRARGT